MADGDFIGVDIKGLDALLDKLEALPEEAQDAAVEAVAVYLRNVLRAYPPKNSITRAQAYGDMGYGPGWFSDKQRRWFFANLREGNISVPYDRTQELADAWEIIGHGSSILLANEAPAAVFTMGDDTQSRHEALVGWKKLGAILQERVQRITEIADGAIKKVLK